VNQTDVQLPQPDESKRRNRWFAAAGIAAVAGVFCAIVAAVLIGELLRDARENPLAAAKLEKIDAQIKVAETELKDLEGADEPPPDEVVKPRYEQIATMRAEYRRADECIRKDYFERRRFVVRGAWLLLAGAVVLAVALKTAFKLAERPPQPLAGDPAREQPARTARFARWAVATCGLCAAAAMGMVVVLSGKPPLPHAIKDQGLASTSPSAGGTTAQRVVPAHEHPKLTTRPVTEGMLAKNWIGFRGYCGLGIATTQPSPTDWDGKSGKNVLWKTPVPLPGNNSPIVFEDRVFLCGSDGFKREVYCYDAADGDLIWRVLVGQSEKQIPEEEVVNKGTGWAPSTMATDGNRVFAIFPSGELVCLDMNGVELWRKRWDLSDNAYGHAASLLVYNNLLFVQLDQGKTAKTAHSIMLALDTVSGNEIWMMPRPVIQSWATPIVAKTPTGVQLVVAGNPWMIAYEPQTGKEIWKLKAFGGELAPSPGYAGGLVYMGVESSDLLAIPTGLGGELSEGSVVWKTSDAYLPDIVSILATPQRVFSVKGGRIVCLDAKTGPKNDEPLWDADVSGIDFKATPILVGDTVYALDSDGVMHMFRIDENVSMRKVGKKEESTSRKAALGEPCQATPAFANGRIYIRGETNLYCIGK